MQPPLRNDEPRVAQLFGDIANERGIRQLDGAKEMGSLHPGQPGLTSPPPLRRDEDLQKQTGDPHPGQPAVGNPPPRPSAPNGVNSRWPERF